MKNPQQATSLCHACPKLCRPSCPVSTAENNEATTPWGKMSLMKFSDQGHLPFDSHVASYAYKCLHCLASEKACEMNNPVSSSLMHYRSQAFEKGVSPASIYDYVEKFKKKDSPYATDLVEKLAKLFPNKPIEERKSVAYFPSCTEVQHSPSVIRKTIGFFRKKGVDLGLCQESIPCCGYPLYLAGDREGFREIAEMNVQGLKHYREVWVGSPACLYTMDHLYQEVGYPSHTRFFHVTEKILPLLPPLQASHFPIIAYHDPCLLGRGRGLYEPPREILKKLTGEQPREFFMNREESGCCGGGGLLPVTSPETARAITESRIQEFKKTGAETLVSSCLGCLLRFKEIDPKLKIKSILEMLPDV